MVGIGLILLTVGSFWIGIDHFFGTMWSGLLVMSIAFAKAGAVAHSFLEVRSAPRVLVAAVATWFVLTAAVVLGFLVIT